MDHRIQAIERAQLKSSRPSFRAGDTVRVYVRIQEDEKSRIQPFEGVVIARKGGSVRETFTVRRVSYGEGVERTFPVHSPLIEKIQVLKQGKVRRAKLYYLRKKKGKAARISSETLRRSEDSSGQEVSLDQGPKTKRSSSVRPETPTAAKA